jgi:hypothetical protein
MYDNGISYSVERTATTLAARSYLTLKKAQSVRARFLRTHNVDPDHVSIYANEGSYRSRRILTPWRKVV